MMIGKTSALSVMALAILQLVAVGCDQPPLDDVAGPSPGGDVGGDAVPLPADGAAAPRERRPAAAEEVTSSSQSLSSAAVWPDATTDGSPPAICPTGFAAGAAICTGWYCDNIQLGCDRFPGTLGAPRPTPFISEEGGRNHARCAANEWATGIECSGDWCDNVRLECRPSDYVGENCRWTESISEESPGYLGGPNEFIKEVMCEGSYCDNMRFFVCQVPRNSCVGRCGGAAPSGRCWCDSLCSRYGDCCTDYAPVCR